MSKKTRSKKKPSVSSTDFPPAVSRVVKAGETLEIDAIRFLRLDAQTSSRAFSEYPKALTADIGFTKPLVELRDGTVRITSTFHARFWPDPNQGQTVPFLAVSADTEMVYRRRKTEASHRLQIWKSSP